MKLTALLTATLALTPALLHAQPLTAAAASDTTGNAPIRVSTGVVPPRLIHSIDIPSDPSWEWQIAGKERTAEVSMTVDATGTPTNLKIVKSAGADLISTCSKPWASTASPPRPSTTRSPPWASTSP